MLKRSDIEFEVREAQLPCDDRKLRARHQIWQIVTYDANRIKDQEFEELKNQLYECIRRELYGEIETEVFKLEAQVLRNTNLPFDTFNKIKDLIQCKNDTLTLKPSVSTE